MVFILEFNKFVLVGKNTRSLKVHINSVWIERIYVGKENGQVVNRERTNSTLFMPFLIKTLMWLIILTTRIKDK